MQWSFVIFLVLGGKISSVKLFIGLSHLSLWFTSNTFFNMYDIIACQSVWKFLLSHVSSWFAGNTLFTCMIMLPVKACAVKISHVSHFFMIYRRHIFYMYDIIACQGMNKISPPLSCLWGHDLSRFGVKNTRWYFVGGKVGVVDYLKLKL